jgi:hypothetical protein
METREVARTFPSVQRTLDVVEQALYEGGAVIRGRESNRVLARKRASGASPDAEIEVEAEPCFQWSQIAVRDATTYGSG